MTAATKKTPAAGKLGGRGRADTSTRVETESRGTSEPTAPRRGRPAVAGEPREHVLRVRLTGDEWARLEAVAGRLRVSEWVRNALVERLASEEAD